MYEAASVSGDGGLVVIDGSSAYSLGRRGTVTKWDLMMFGPAYKIPGEADRWSGGVYSLPDATTSRGLSHGAIAQDGGVLATTGGDHAVSGDWATMGNYWRPGQLFKLNAADGNMIWGVSPNTTTPPVTGRGDLVFVGTIPLPAILDEAHKLTPGHVEAYDAIEMSTHTNARIHVSQPICLSD